MLTTTELILAITNIILIIIIFFLFKQLRKSEKNREPKKDEQSDMTGIADIAPGEFKHERFELKPQDIIPEKTNAESSGTESRIENQEKAELKLEGELPEIEATPEKKSSKKKKPAKKKPKKERRSVQKEQVVEAKLVQENTEEKRLDEAIREYIKT